jgi:hypothetical protein
LDIVIVIMLLQFGSMGQITHTQKIGHSLEKTLSSVKLPIRAYPFHI